MVKKSIVNTIKQYLTVRAKNGIHVQFAVICGDVSLHLLQPATLFVLLSTSTWTRLISTNLIFLD